MINESNEYIKLAISLILIAAVISIVMIGVRLGKELENDTISKSNMISNELENKTLKSATNTRYLLGRTGVKSLINEYDNITKIKILLTDEDIDHGYYTQTEALKRIDEITDFPQKSAIEMIANKDDTYELVLHKQDCNFDIAECDCTD